MIQRRTLLALATACATLSLAARARAAASQPVRVAGGWRMHDREYQVGALRVHWDAARIEIESAVTVSSRPHAVVPEAGGGFMAVATRPGTWMLRVDAEGRLARQVAMADEGDARTLDGHVIASRDGQWLYTGETDRRSGEGWVSVRDARNLRKVHQFRTGGIDPHQILVADDGMLLVANGGIPRTPTGGKRDLDQMDPALVRLNPANGEVLGEWKLPDRRLSPHHIAWNQPAGSQQRRLLGIGLQAEHDMEIFDYDNILLLPRKCRVESRSECDTSVEFGGRPLQAAGGAGQHEDGGRRAHREWLAASGHFYVMHRFDLDTWPMRSACASRACSCRSARASSRPTSQVIDRLAPKAWVPTTSPSTSRTAMPTACAT
jgi:hypothetical protein